MRGLTHQRGGWIGAALLLVLNSFPLRVVAQTSSFTGQLFISLAEGPGLNEANYRLVQADRTRLRLLIGDQLLVSAGGWRTLDQRVVTVTGPVTTVVDPGTGEVSATVQVQTLQAVGPQPSYLSPSGAPPVSGNQKWVVVGCRYSDDPSTPTTPADWTSFLGSTSPGLDHFWRELSGDLVNLTGSTATNWYPLPQPASYYNPETTTMKPVSRLIAWLPTPPRSITLGSMASSCSSMATLEPVPRTSPPSRS